MERTTSRLLHFLRQGACESPLFWQQRWHLPDEAEGVMSFWRWFLWLQEQRRGPLWVIVEDKRGMEGQLRTLRTFHDVILRLRAFRTNDHAIVAASPLSPCPPIPNTPSGFTLFVWKDETPCILRKVPTGKVGRPCEPTTDVMRASLDLPSPTHYHLRNG